MVSKITLKCWLIFDGFGKDFGGFLAPEINQNRYQILDPFLEAFKIGLLPLTGGSLASRSPPKDT